MMLKKNNDTSLLMGIGLGPVFGIIIGELLRNVPLGFAIGSFIGIGLGATGVFTLRSW